MSDPGECPHLDPGPVLRCLDPFAREYLTPPAAWLRRWCLGDFRACPVFQEDALAFPAPPRAVSPAEAEEWMGEIAARS